MFNKRFHVVHHTVGVSHFIDGVLQSNRAVLCDQTLKTRSNFVIGNVVTNQYHENWKVGNCAAVFLPMNAL